MSTNYIPLKKVLGRDLFDGRLEKYAVREHPADGSDEWNRCLTDGDNYLWVFIDNDGYVFNIRRAGANAPGKILNAIADAFDTEIASEYQPQYWGFDTQEGWDAWLDELAKQGREEFYVELLKYLRGKRRFIVFRLVDARRYRPHPHRLGRKRPQANVALTTRTGVKRRALRRQNVVRA